MTAPLYKPFTKVTTREYPYLSLVTQADPDWARGKYWDIEYEWSNRAYYANPYQRGAYNRRDNVYPVGQPYGGLDPLVTAALAPTVGNPVPGLYQAVPDGRGWG